MSAAVPARGAPSPRLARLRFFKLPEARSRALKEASAQRDKTSGQLIDKSRPPLALLLCDPTAALVHKQKLENIY